MGKRIEHQPGERRGRLTYVTEIEPGRASGGKPRRRGRFRCDCGAEVDIELGDWRSGHTASCGCLKVEMDHARFLRHGAAERASTAPLYRAWKAMRSRCRPSAKRPWYAGVSCDPRWATFEGFLANQPAGRPFEPGLVLARHGDRGDYTPENTRWVTKTENGRERTITTPDRTPDGRFAPGHN